MKRALPLLGALIVLGLSLYLNHWLREKSPQPTSPPSSPEASTTTIPTPPDYTFQPATPDGIGKLFMGREISHVMGHQAIDWLERGNREQEEAPSKMLSAIDLPPDAVLADIGAGSGYHAFRLAPRLPQGRVIAVDIQQEMLDFLTKKSRELEITNVTPHLGAIDDIKLPPASIDAALLVDAYHEFSHPKEMLTSLHRALKPGGRIFLMEFRGEDDRVPIKPLHKMTEAQARKEFEACGFRFVENRRLLPWQHFLVFSKP